MSVAAPGLVYSPNVIKSPFPDLVHIPEIPLTHFVFQNVNRFADKPAFIDGNTGQVYTFRDLYGNMKKFAYGLHLRGFKKGDVLALYSPNCIQFPVIFHGVSYLGGILTTVNPLYTADELAHQLQDASATYVVTATAFLDKALAASIKNPHIKEIITIDPFSGPQPSHVVISNFSSFISPPSTVLNDRPSFRKYLHDVEKLSSPAIDCIRDVVAIPYSSGTTGMPKGTMLTHYNLVSNLLQIESTNSEADSRDTILGVLPFFHIYALELLVNYAVFQGTTVVVMTKFELEQYLQLAEKYKATYLYLVPPIALGLAKSPVVDKFNLKSIRTIVSAAAPLAGEVEEALAKRLNVNVKQAYGMTELSPVSHITPARIKRGSIGVLVANCVAKVVDLNDHKKVVKPGQEGELWVKGPNVMKGYLNRPDATAHTIDHEGFLHTGDIAIVDEEGYFYVVDRVKELIKYKGFQVAPAELEGIILTHSAVADVAVIPKPDDEAGELPKAFVVVKPGLQLAENDLIKFVEDKVAPHKRLRGGVELIDAIPKTASGKILRRILVQKEREKAWAKNVNSPKAKLSTDSVSDEQAGVDFICFRPAQDYRYIASLSVCAKMEMEPTTTSSDVQLQVEENNAAENEESLKSGDLWDYVIMFGNVTPPTDGNGNQLSEDDQKVIQFRTSEEKRKVLIEKMTSPTVGLQVTEKRSIDDKVLFLLITTSQARLEAEAERTQINVRLKESRGGGYVDFQIADKQHYEETPEGIFSKIQRISLVESILEADEEDGGCGLNIQKEIKRGNITRVFPLHQEDKRKEFLSVLANPWNIVNSFQPLDIHKIRNYFGEDIALYFAWLGFYTKWLLGASAVGAICFVFWVIGARKQPQEGEVYTERYLWTNWFAIGYSVFLALWATFYLEFWTRKNNALNYEWGMEDYLEQERERPDFIGEDTPGVYSNGIWITFDPDEETGLETIPKQKYYPATARQYKIASAIPLLVFMMAVVVFVTVCILSFRVYLQTEFGDTQAASYGGGFVGAIVNAMTILFMNAVWKIIALKLTEWENHRTDTDFENALIAKIFVVYFVNSYTSLFYVGFFKKTAKYWNKDQLKDGCKASAGWDVFGYGCADELTIQLVSILAVNLFVGQFREVMLPWLVAKVKLYILKKQEGDAKIPQWEKQSQKPQFPGTFDEYSEMILQYGYVTMFAAAFPLAPLMAFVNNVIEIRTDAFKLLDAYSRPKYKGTESIGAWKAILEIMGVISVITNCLLIGFQFAALAELLEYSKFHTLGAIVITEHVVLMLKWLISMVVPDYPGWISKKKAKQAYLEGQEFRKFKTEKMREKTSTWAQYHSE